MGPPTPEENDHVVHWNPLFLQGDGNATCAQLTSCSPCLEFFGGDDASGCVWCNVPTTGDRSHGRCLQRSDPGDSCEVGELQVSCTLVPVSVA